MQTTPEVRVVEDVSQAARGTLLIGQLGHQLSWYMVSSPVAGALPVECQHAAHARCVWLRRLLTPCKLLLSHSDLGN